MEYGARVFTRRGRMGKTEKHLSLSLSLFAARTLNAPLVDCAHSRNTIVPPYRAVDPNPFRKSERGDDKSVTRFALAEFTRRGGAASPRLPRDVVFPFFFYFCFLPREPENDPSTIFAGK